VTPPTWVDAPGPTPPEAGLLDVRPRGRAPMRFRAADLPPHGWVPPQTLQIPDWCGCSTEYLPVPVGDGWWSLVPIWEPDQTVNPLRRYGPAEPS
jgi:hypothetical protein